MIQIKHTLDEVKGQTSTRLCSVRHSFEQNFKYSGCMTNPTDFTWRSASRLVGTVSNQFFNYSTTNHLSKEETFGFG